MSVGSSERIVCACSRVTARELAEAIAAGATTLEALAKHVDAGTGCRTCHPELRGLVAAAALRRLRGARPAAGEAVAPAEQTEAAEDAEENVFRLLPLSTGGANARSQRRPR